MRSWQSLLRLALVFLFGLVCVSATAQTWWVQSADYGAGRQRQDVTNTVRRLVSGPSFRVNNANLGGDPYVGADKTLRIVGRSTSGQIRDFSYKEGSTVNSSLFRGTPWGGGTPGTPNNGYALQIITARWGAGTKYQNVTRRLQGMVRNNRLSVKVTPQNMGGDPTPGVSKKVIVDYRYQSRQRQVTRVEGEMLNLP